ncbi:sulfurtransferase [Arthrobacter gengyunqii]|uniref:Sulfurtransferase n=1 Tax=Arthrobacter gengyunqii TaxID=2886940 RepID=A0ABS8GKE1_9MICC|nr:sulfurtransferase [Arthrobacter gengyunqii]MCC3267117.1 sulfurtransferase [Arthrobacter gengyunqii]
MSGPVIDVHALQELLAKGEPVVLLDVRWALGHTDGHKQFERGHIPGAVYVDLEKELAAPAGNGSAGRHPLPDPEDFHRTVRRWGVNAGDTVVVYDAVSGTSAARAWWLLRHAGLEDVYLLDGGVVAWHRAGFALQGGAVVPAPGNVELSWGRMPVLEMWDVPAVVAAGRLLDARSRDRYRGDREPVDPQAGHIPGAVNAPTPQNLTEQGTFRTPEELRAAYEALGVRRDAPVAVYCGSGISAAHDVVALEMAGYRAALYPGSWSQWSSTKGSPVEVGTQAGEWPGTVKKR